MVVGSNLEHDAMPAWYRNLQAHPDATIHVDPQSRSVTAESLAGDERECAWERMVAASPGYAAMQAKTQREFTIVRLVRARDGWRCAIARAPATLAAASARAG